ncbi:MAG: 2,3,4,5-tetrahydropyridine-2,6-dicarboxylate N-succinyltransferase [Deltaproteobacteria bacterium]|nr:2,3,4,5-tetrahydropyridine-2,6-dicarboxylate N-succinyltransferase [Deltaproteobacteria bacterium]
MDLATWTQTLARIRPLPPADPAVRAAFLEFRDALQRGTLRAASRGTDGAWVVHPDVKEGILLGFRAGALVQMDAGLSYVDKDTYPARRFTPEDRVRVVPGGSAVRTGAYVAPGVVIMPPAYVNVGAYVDEGTMVDSHALVGSCAQVGRRVHLSAGCQVGGVIEPIGALPVIVGDDAFLGGNTGVYEGVQVGEGAVLGSGVVVNGSSAVFDMVRNEVYRARGGALRIPDGAVVVMGTRPAPGALARAHGLSIMTPLIVKYRDAKTTARAALEDAVRGF